MLEQAQQQHKHDIVYYGVVNLIHDSNVIGAIDVWRCRGCPEIFCEDKRYGIMDLAAEVASQRSRPGRNGQLSSVPRKKGQTGLSRGRNLEVSFITPVHPKRR